ncbi:MAG: hypothetical protein IJX47_07165 [Clostridia bacterium]|nr:hypothetical protein [Clostridia bacterium]
MMKKYLFGAVALLLANLLLLSGCGKVTEVLDEHFPEESVTEDADPLIDPLPDRVGRTYVILLTTELESDSALSTVSLLTFDTADESIHWLELPSALYVRAAGNTLDGVFGRAYQTELASESGTSVSAANAAVSAVRSLLEKGFSITVDYSVNLDREQFTDFVGTLGGVPLTLSQTLGGLDAGEYTLNAQNAISFLTYDQYNDPTEGQFSARRAFTAALRQRAVEKLALDQLSLYTMELRGEMTTDIPSTGGQDMFFLRRFLVTDNDDFTVTNISTQSVYYNNARYRVLVKDNTLRQLNQQMRVYQKDVETAQFDPSGVFVDPSNQIMQSVYASSTALPTVYTLTALLRVEEDTETDAPPASSDVPAEPEAASDADDA